LICELLVDAGVGGGLAERQHDLVDVGRQRLKIPVFLSGM
jgi:hypothetical protein